MIVEKRKKKIADLVKTSNNKCENKNSVVYKIPCNSCDSAYYGETYRGMEKRVREHKADVRYHRTTSALVNHVDEVGHLPNWDGAMILDKCMSKQRRKAMEALYISIFNNINQRTGDIKWTKITAAVTAKQLERKRVGHLRPDSPPDRGPHLAVPNSRGDPT